MGTLAFELFKGMENIKIHKGSIIIGDYSEIWWV